MTASEKDLRSERFSLNHWRAKGRNLDQTASSFFDQLQREEMEKRARLEQLATAYKLPIYSQIDLSAEAAETIENHCRMIEREAGWGIALKITAPSGLVTDRRLGATTSEVVIALGSAAPNSTVSLTPYREPDISGTLWKRDDQLLIEFVEGPHFWLSKQAPESVDVVIAKASQISPFLRLEPVCLIEIDARLRRIARQAIRQVFGRGLSATLALEMKAYAEFHWFEASGLRFIECSFATVWTR